MFDEEKYDVDDQAKGGRQKCLSLMSKGGYVLHLDFADRPGLRNLLRSFSELFLPVYDVDQNEDTETKVAFLKTEQGGGLRIHGMILELIERAKKSRTWPSGDRSKKVGVRPPITQKVKRQRDDSVLSPPVFHISSTPKTSDRDPDDGGRKSKRVCSEAQI